MSDPPPRHNVGGQMAQQCKGNAGEQSVAPRLVLMTAQAAEAQQLSLTVAPGRYCFCKCRVSKGSR